MNNPETQFRRSAANVVAANTNRSFYVAAFSSEERSEQASGIERESRSRDSSALHYRGRCHEYQNNAMLRCCDA